MQLSLEKNKILVLRKLEFVFFFFFKKKGFSFENRIQELKIKLFSKEKLRLELNTWWFRLRMSLCLESISTCSFQLGLTLHM